MRSFFHEKQLLHTPKTYLSRGQMRTPEEVPQRALELLGALEQMGMSVESPTDHGHAPLLQVHSLGYLRFLESAYRRWHALPYDWGDEVISNVFIRENNPLNSILAEAAYYLADGSCPIGEHTWTSAYWSAQTALSAAQAVVGGAPSAYALTRPTAHHARRDAAGGFCYINNCALAAEALLHKYRRVVILDPDMHHGQGIQEIFYRRNDVFYISIHGDTRNFYPVVTGLDTERGEGPGHGYNLNLPMPHGSKEEVFFDRLDTALAAIRIYQPEAIVLALGFDMYKDDPQSKIAFPTSGFTQLGAMVRDLALPTVIVQEGGYCVEALGKNLTAYMNGFLQ
ncbi:histone deacetylase family protein [Castellaniella sp.]|uniref:histone deacetylase family protein n=1 Tax=Castellaniella sp. TaxID=1955812 RepID=UPI00355E0111